MTDMFAKPSGKITIKSLDDGVEVQAHYNPKELQIDREVPWSIPSNADQAGGGGGGGGGGSKKKAQKHGDLHQEYGGVKPRTVTVEMLFDGYEKSASGAFKVDVMERISALEHMATVIDGKGPEEKRRAHHCVVDWGSSLRTFKCVIKSLSTKYTMFDSGGNPLRATCTVKLEEAHSVGVPDKKKK